MSLTRFLMTASVMVLAPLGLAGSFLPQELLRAAGAEPTPALALLVQVTGALYLGFAMLNWMVRDSRIGGIFNRPIVVGNLVHFTSAGLAMLKGVARDPGREALGLLAILYVAFAAGFGVVMYRTPKSSADKDL
jgi:hypothetical protein